MFALGSVLITITTETKRSTLGFLARDNKASLFEVSVMQAKSSFINGISVSVITGFRAGSGGLFAHIFLFDFPQHDKVIFSPR